MLTSSVLDKRGDKFALNHRNSSWLKGFNTLGNALPYVGAGLVAMAALDGSDPRRSRTGYAALESAGAAFVASTAMKYVVGRDRPQAGLGSTSFKPLSRREHWVSDVVAGSLLGYGIGRIFWESSPSRSKGAPRASVDLTGISLAWELD